MSNLKQDVDGEESGIIETKSRSTESVCKNITKSLERICPKCNIILKYSTIGNRNLANRKKNLCRKCTFTGRYPSEKAREKMAVSQSKRKHPESVKQKMCGTGNGMYGVHRYDHLNPFHGKCHTEEARRKMRIAACERVRQLQRSNDGRINNIGKKEGKYFDQLEKEMRWNGIYYEKSSKQFLVEYLGYFVDYYEPTHNVVVEYDEPRHYKKGILKEKDRIRMEQIKSHLKCGFWRYDAYRNQLTKSHPSE